MNINELMSNIQVLVPFRNAFESDNVGLVIGSEKEEVKKIIVATGIDHNSPARIPFPFVGDQLSLPLSIYRNQRTGRAISQLLNRSQIACPICNSPKCGK